MKINDMNTTIKISIIKITSTRLFDSDHYKYKGIVFINGVNAGGVEQIAKNRVKFLEKVTYDIWKTYSNRRKW